MISFRKFLLIIVLFPFVVSCGILERMNDDGKIYFCEYRGGYWGKWDDGWSCCVKGTVDSFVLYDSINHPSEWGTKITVYGLNSKEDLSDEWQKYSGKIEFYSIESSAIKAAQSKARNASWCYIRPSGSRVFSRPASISVKRERIRVVYNVFFDDVGIGISLPVS